MAGGCGAVVDGARHIHADVLSHGVDLDTGALSISYASSGLDAATLMAPLLGFLDPQAPAVVATTNAIMWELMDAKGLMYRYRDFNAGVGGEEGTFIMCSYWLAETLALQGRRREAVGLIEQVLGYSSPTGLLSEIVESTSGELLGNYLQAYSHLGLIRMVLAWQVHD